MLSSSSTYNCNPHSALECRWWQHEEASSSLRDVRSTHLRFLNLSYLNPRHFRKVSKQASRCGSYYLHPLIRRGSGCCWPQKEKVENIFKFFIPSHNFLFSESGQAMRNMRRLSTCLVWHSSWSWFMDHEIGPRKMVFSHGLTWWSNFHGPISLKNQFTKLLGSSLGVNWMWLRGMTMHQKVNVLISS